MKNRKSSKTLGDFVRLRSNIQSLETMHLMVRRLGLVDQIDRHLRLLRIHLPYHESDHVLNIAYNLLAGGTCLEDLELLRNNEVYLDALGAWRGACYRKEANQMASISREEAGRRAIQFVGRDKRRRSIWLGKVTQRTAEAIKIRVEHLATAAVTGHALDAETARWEAVQNSVQSVRRTANQDT